ncbi:Cyclic AMP-dependent transcription factor ATF-5 [Channa argus]|uniref:Cyclic AMP-dependent transcription factor ATF-5 n=1 Tax=Channa argus TaxID=215402 RepID=A0A6G1QTZ4_CHAAH|nr:Cyclic AMP-dependent transcription factor ATF-5 [Channa argus]
MMATSAPVWKTPHVCPADLLALSHPQANHSQSQGCRGEVSEENQHLIGDGLTDWMTEEVDFSSYLPNPPSPPSSTNASLPPSPLQNDIQVPSDLEVMTSLLQEELAQLEDYFLSEPLPEKGPRLGKCDRGPVPAGPQPFSQLPYASYPTSNQSEPSPLLVTLATGELDLLSICGGPIGRSKIPRHTPYSCSRPTGCGRKRVSEGVRFREGYDNSLLSSKGSISGNSAVTLTSNYGCVEDEQLVGKSYCLGSAVELRRCTVLPKEEKNCCFSQDVIGGAKVVGGGFGFGGSLDVPHKKEDLLMYSMREVSSGSNSEVLNSIKTSVELTKATVSWKSESSESYLRTTPQSEAYHGFLGGINEQVKTESLQIGQHDLHCNFLEDQGPECLLMTRESLNLESSGHRQACRLKEDHCAVKYEVDIIPVESGERKQKKRDQNKTAAHRYRQRKRQELDSLEEQLHCLEGRNRELRDKAESVEREIQYVKDLLIEVYKARSQRLKQDTTA